MESKVLTSVKCLRQLQHYKELEKKCQNLYKEKFPDTELSNSDPTSLDLLTTVLDKLEEKKRINVKLEEEHLNYIKIEQDFRRLYHFYVNNSDLDDTSFRETASPPLSIMVKTLSERLLEYKKLNNELESASKLLKTSTAQNKMLILNGQQLNHKLMNAHNKLADTTEQLKEQRKLTATLENENKALQVENETLKNTTSAEGAELKLDQIQKVMRKLNSTSSNLINSVNVQRFESALKDFSVFIRDYCSKSARQTREEIVKTCTDEEVTQNKSNEIIAKLAQRSRGESIETAKAGPKFCEKKIDRINEVSYHIQMLLECLERIEPIEGDDEDAKIRHEKKKLRLDLDYLKELLHQKITK